MASTPDAVTPTGTKNQWTFEMPAYDNRVCRHTFRRHHHEQRRRDNRDNGNKLKNPTVVNDPEQESSYMKGFRAYFQLKGEGAQARSFSLNLGEEATGISEIENGKLNIENGVYDLQGRRMESSMFNIQSSMLKKGVYIQNGKKTVVR